MTTDKPNWYAEDGYWWAPASEPPALHIVLNQQEAQELRTMLNRALNTLNPDHWPSWAAMLLEKLTCTNDQQKSDER